MRALGCVALGCVVNDGLQESGSVSEGHGRLGRLACRYVHMYIVMYMCGRAGNWKLETGNWTLERESRASFNGCMSRVQPNQPSSNRRLLNAFFGLPLSPSLHCMCICKLAHPTRQPTTSPACGPCLHAPCMRPAAASKGGRRGLGLDPQMLSTTTYAVRARLLPQTLRRLPNPRHDMARASRLANMYRVHS